MLSIIKKWYHKVKAWYYARKYNKLSHEWKIITEVSALNKGLETSIIQQQLYIDDIVCIAIALMLQNGGNEFVIKQELIQKIIYGETLLKYKLVQDGLAVWLDLKKQQTNE